MYQYSINTIVLLYAVIVLHQQHSNACQMLGLAGSPQYSEQSAELIWSTALNYWALIEGAARVRRDTGKDC